MLWLSILQKMRTTDQPAELPNTDTLVMCFGKRIRAEENGTGFGTEDQLDVLQVRLVSAQRVRRCALLVKLQSCSL
jgi:hypothetical protein